MFLSYNLKNKSITRQELVKDCQNDYRILPLAHADNGIITGEREANINQMQNADTNRI